MPVMIGSAPAGSANIYHFVLLIKLILYIVFIHGLYVYYFLYSFVVLCDIRWDEAFTTAPPTVTVSFNHSYGGCFPR